MGRLGAKDNGIEAWFPSFPCLRLFLPVLLAGAVELRNPPKAPACHAKTSADGADIPWASCRLRDGTRA